VATHWTDRSDLIWDGLTYPEHALGDVACVSLEAGDAGWKVWASGYSPLTEEGEEPPLIDLLRVDLATGERTTFQVPHLYQHLAVDDLDGDGQDDIAAFQRGADDAEPGRTHLRLAHIGRDGRGGPGLRGTGARLG
jgi:hypothetical protein